MTARSSATWVVVVAALLAACSPSGPADEQANPLAAGCRLVAAHAALDVSRDDTGGMRSFSRRLDAEADTVSSSDAAELRPLARAAAAVAQAPRGNDRVRALDDYRVVLAATERVCAAARSAPR